MEHDDFFEDDLAYDEEIPKETSKGKAKGKSAGKAKGKSKAEPPKSRVTDSSDESEAPMVSLNWVIAIAVAALIVGFVARGMFQPAQTQYGAATTGTGTVQQGGTGDQTGTTQLPPGHPQVQPGQQAPPLTQEQIDAGVKSDPSGSSGSSGSSNSKKKP